MAQYRECILSQASSSNEVKQKLVESLNDVGWPAVWQSAARAKHSMYDLTYAWGNAENDLLFRMRKDTNLSWGKLAQCFFLDSSAEDCENQYKLLNSRAE